MPYDVFERLQPAVYVHLLHYYATLGQLIVYEFLNIHSARSFSFVFVQQV